MEGCQQVSKLKSVLLLLSCRGNLKKECTGVGKGERLEGRTEIRETEILKTVLALALYSFLVKSYTLNSVICTLILKGEIHNDR